MRRHEPKIYPAKVCNELAEVACDLCGAKSGMGGMAGESWERSCYDMDETHVEREVRTRAKREVGSSCPDGSSTETTFVDICPKCFDEKLLPWLKGLGVEPQKETLKW